MEDIAQFVQPALLWSAFWVALLGRSHRFEAALGLIVGAGLAHLGWALLHFDRLAARPLQLFDPSAGYTILLLPLGPLVVATLCARGVGGAGSKYRTDAAVCALPLGFAVARLGCVFAKCCGARALGEAPDVARLPLQWIELVGWLAAAWLLARVPKSASGPAFCALFGGLRLVLEPYREAPPLGAPVFSPLWLALGWLLAGLVWAGLRARRSAYSSSFVWNSAS